MRTIVSGQLPEWWGYMRLGIGSYTYTWAVGVPGHLPLRPLSAIDLLANASRLGLRGPSSATICR